MSQFWCMVKIQHYQCPSCLPASEPTLFHLTVFDSQRHSSLLRKVKLSKRRKSSSGFLKVLAPYLCRGHEQPGLLQLFLGNPKVGVGCDESRHHGASNPNPPPQQHPECKVFLLLLFLGSWPWDDSKFCFAQSLQSGFHLDLNALSWDAFKNSTVIHERNLIPDLGMLILLTSG